MIDVPMRLEDITAAWLTAALREGGLEVAPVAAVTEDIIGDVSGMTGAIARLHVTYAAGGEPGPASLIAKCPLDDDLNRMLNTFTRMYERESTFYADYAADDAVRSPRCFYNGYQPETDQHMLLLEDLADARAGDNNAGLGPGDAEAAVDALATLHGHYWGRIGDHQLMDFANPLWRQGIPIMQDAWGQMLMARPGMVPADVAASVEAWYVDDWDRWLAAEQAADHTLVHGDFRADNMLFAPDGSVAVIDWQMLTRSSAGFDLAWFFGTSFTDEMVEDREPLLLERWARGVAAAGGPSLDEGGVRELLCLGSLPWITNIAQIFTREFDEPHLLALQVTLGERMVRSCTRWGLPELFPP